LGFDIFLVRVDGSGLLSIASLCR